MSSIASLQYNPSALLSSTVSAKWQQSAAATVSAATALQISKVGSTVTVCTSPVTLTPSVEETVAVTLNSTLAADLRPPNGFTGQYVVFVSASTVIPGHVSIANGTVLISLLSGQPLVAGTAYTVPSMSISYSL